MMEKQTVEKKAWVAPELEVLDIDQTLGGTLLNRPESFVIAQTPPLPAVFGTVPG